MKPSLKSWTARLPDLLARLGRWWLGEFLDLFPDRIAQWLLGRGRGLLAIVPGPDAVDLELMTDSRQSLALGRVGLSEYAPSSIEHFLHAHGFARADVDIGLRLPAEQIFARKLLVPAEAAGAVDDILAQDLARKTPFRLADVYHGHASARAASADKITVWQWVTRRDFVAQATAAMAADIADLAFVDAPIGPDRDAPAPFIWLRPNARAGRSWVQRSAMALGCTAVVLALAAGGQKYWRQQMLLDDLDARIATTRAKAQQVRAAVDKLEQKQSVVLRLRAQKSDLPGLLDIWEEATRVLPSHSWLTELRLAETSDKHEQQVAMIGFSAAATNLVGIVDRSPLFVDAALTAPVALDPVEGRERFALQAKVKKQDVLKEAAR
jgi:general secretion pathway protein L